MSRRSSSNPYGAKVTHNPSNTTSDKIAAADRNIARLGILASVFAKTDRILSGRADLSVRVVHSGDAAPSFTDGTVIYLNADLVPMLVNTAALVAVTGLNYHELAHVLFSPRSNDPYGRDLLREGLFSTANLLEDQRIETAFCGLYPPAKSYFTEVVSRYIATGEQYDGAFVLTHGRRYLPVGVRSMLRQRYKHQVHVPELRGLIDEYRVLVYPTDQVRMLEITRRFHAILNSTQTTIPNPHGECAEHVNTGSADKDKGQSGSAAAQQDDTDDLDDGSGEGEGEGEGSTSGQDAGQGSAADSEGTAGGKGAGQGNGVKPEQPAESTSTPPSDSDITDALNDAADLAQDDEDVQQEVGDLTSTMNQQSKEESLAAADQYVEVEITADVSTTYRHVSREFQRIFAEHESGWERGVESGRLSVAQVMRSTARDGYVDQESAFDRWSPDQREDIGLEVVILVDQSGSMCHSYNAPRGALSPIGMASNALYTMKRALDDVDANTTVIGFGSFAGTLYKRSERAPKGVMRRFDANKGGTSPWDALRVANSILSGSDRPNKVLAVFTDGQWNDYLSATGHEHASVPAMDALIKSMPWTTGLFGIGKGSLGYGQHGCKIGGEITDYEEFVKVMRDVVTQVLKTIR